LPCLVQFKVGRWSRGNSFLCQSTSLALTPPRGIPAGPTSWLLLHPYHLQASLWSFQLSLLCRSTFGETRRLVCVVLTLCRK
jgi:hypothetical protein